MGGKEADVGGRDAESFGGVEVGARAGLELMDGVGGQDALKIGRQAGVGDLGVGDGLGGVGQRSQAAARVLQQRQRLGDIGIGGQGAQAA